MDMNFDWIQLQDFCDAARHFPELQVWLFGSALRSTKPADLDVLVIYRDRTDITALKAAGVWRYFDPPLHITGMTADEERFYNFKETTNAERLV